MFGSAMAEMNRSRELQLVVRHMGAGQIERYLLAVEAGDLSSVEIVEQLAFIGGDQARSGCP